MWIVRVDNIDERKGITFVDVYYRTFPIIGKIKIRRAFKKSDQKNYRWLDNGYLCPRSSSDMFEWCRVSHLVSQYRDDETRKKSVLLAQAAYLTGVDVADME